MLNNKTIIAILMTGFLFTLNAQVTISPTNLFIESGKRFETLLVMNSSDVAQEVSLSWEFGYPLADESGKMKMIYGDEEKAALFSIADWIRGFPKNFIIEPGARQTIRVTVKAPRNLKPGTYWSRLKTTSIPVSPDVGSAPPGGITTQINVAFSQITGVFYKYGKLNTGLKITDVKVQLEDDNPQIGVLAQYNKSGNSPFLGTMAARVYDSKGKLVVDQKMLVSIYFTGLRRLDIDGKDLPSGSYEVEVIFSSGRADIPDSDIIPATTVSTRGNFTKL